MWKELDNCLCRTLTFANFSEAFSFMTRVALEAERRDHHPTWTNTYHTVEIRLSTHSAGNVVTQKDRDLAAAIDKLIPPGTKG
jgi:4a-hydroxytetrahydrobiopterin dehydratase